MIMTKAEIKKGLNKIDTLEKASDIVILNRDCVEELTLERLNRMIRIAEVVLSERTIVLSDFLEEKLQGMRNMIDEEGDRLVSGWFEELGHINAMIHFSESLIRRELFK